MSLDFDPTGSLEIFSTNHSNAGPDVALAGKVQIAERLHRLSWTTHPSFVDGLLVGGHTNGTVSVWDPSAIIQCVNELQPRFLLIFFVVTHLDVHQRGE
jgi:hypothetical protein